MALRVSVRTGLNCRTLVWGQKVTEWLASEACPCERQCTVAVHLRLLLCRGQ